MHNKATPNRHTAGAGIQGEWSNRPPEPPVKRRDLIVASIVMGSLFLAMCIGAANGY